jgi:uncharacterized protein YjbI with pentapeptide repeats
MSNAKLTGANLTGALLARANLRGADLIATNLTGARLFFADLTNAFLTGAGLLNVMLDGTDLSGVWGVTNEELDQQATSLGGATMPDGQKYEDWLKSNGRESDGQNSGTS